MVTVVRSFLAGSNQSGSQRYPFAPGIQKVQSGRSVMAELVRTSRPLIWKRSTSAASWHNGVLRRPSARSLFYYSASAVSMYCHAAASSGVLWSRGV